MLKTLVKMTDISNSWKAEFSSTSRGFRCAENGRFWLTAVGLIRRSLATISLFSTKHLPQKVSTNLCFRETKQFPFKRVPFCTNRLSIWMRENVSRRLQSCISPSCSFPLLKSLLADWPMRTQMRLTNQTKVSFVINPTFQCRAHFMLTLCTAKSVVSSFPHPLPVFCVGFCYYILPDSRFPLIFICHLYLWCCFFFCLYVW